MLAAQEINVTGSLDKPVQQTGMGPALSIRIVGNYFKGFGIANILNRLVTLQQIGSASDEYNITHNWSAQSAEGFYYGSTFWSASQDLSALRSELSKYYNTFPQSSEIFTNSITNSSDPANTIAYYDWYGNEIQRSASSNSDLDATLAKNGQINNTSLRFYAGRNTAAGDANYTQTDEVEITLDNGNKYTIFAYDTTTPLVLDMNGDGKLEASNGQYLPHALIEGLNLVEFDMNGDGFNELVEWVGANDGLLVVYNPEEKVTGKHLFGNATGMNNGYEKLALLDANKDGKIMGEELATLSVWQDKNGNALADEGEIACVKELGITEIKVTHENMISSFIKDGTEYLMWDWHPATLLIK